MARSNLSETQSAMKTWYDRKTVPRSFAPGSKVLLLLPVAGKPLQAKFQGPYRIKQKLNDLNYKIETPDRLRAERICHVNMMKPYYERVNPVAVVAVQPTEVISDPDTSTDHIDMLQIKLNNTQLLHNIELPANINSERQTEFKNLLSEFSTVFADIPTVTHVAVHDIDVGDATPIKQHPYRLHPQKLKLIRSEIETLLHCGIIEKSNSPWSSPVLAVDKPDGSIRLVADMRKVNKVSLSDSYPLPRVDDLIDTIGRAKFLTKWDLRKGFWQVPLTEKAKEICAITTQFGLFQFTVMPFGLKNAPATFQRLMNSVLDGLQDFSVCFIDDICTYSNDWNSHLVHIRRVLERLQTACLTVNLSKCEFCNSSIKYLGHTVGSGQVLPSDAKVRDIVHFPSPSNKKMIRQFLGIVGFYRNFVRNFSEVTFPLTELLKENSKFDWTDSCEVAFTHLKHVLATPPVLAAPDFNSQFFLSVDCSDIGMGACLFQFHSEVSSKSDIQRPVAYFSRKLLPNQQKYSTVEKECLALVSALHHFHVYVSVGTVTVFTDHNPLLYIDKMKSLSNRLFRWSIFLQNYDLQIKHIRGIDNKLPDFLSRS